MVSVLSAGALTVSMLAVPDTVTVLSAASTWLSVAVIVTVLLLVVALASKLRVAGELSVKSVPEPGDAATVTVKAVPEAADNVAVTSVVPPFSEIESFDSASVTDRDGTSSSIDGDHCLGRPVCERYLRRRPRRRLQPYNQRLVGLRRIVIHNLQSSRHARHLTTILA